MSCILFSKASYDAIAKTPTVSNMWNEMLTCSYSSPKEYTDALFNLNKQAYKDRYSIDHVDDDINSDPIDYEFDDFLNADPKKDDKTTLAHFYKLLSRIQYQCSDVDDYQTNDIYKHLRWAMEWAADRLCRLTLGKLSDEDNYPHHYNSKYSRFDAIADGSLIDLMTDKFGSLVTEAGFNYPMAITSTAFNRYVALTPTAQKASNDMKGRLWDILTCNRKVKTYVFEATKEYNEQTMYQVGKKEAGRVLDDKLYDSIPVNV
jgi:hypothetical protein